MSKTKRDQMAEEIEGNVAVQEKPEDKEQPKRKANEFGDEYTLEVIADYDPAADIFRISNKDPNFEYRFLRDEFENISIKTSNLLHQGGGWQICPKKHLLRIGIEEKNLSPDGFYRIGKHILAFMPKELFLKKQAGKQEKANAPIDQINRLIKEGNPSVGGKEIHNTMRGIQPGHKLGFGNKQED